MTDTQLQKGFTEPVRDAQQAFRQLLKVMSEPGVIRTLDYADALAELSPAALSTLLSLMDQTTGLWLSPSLDTDLIRTNLNFHAGAPCVDEPAEADFVMAKAGELTSLDGLKIGEPEYPDRSCTLVIQVDRIEPDCGDSELLTLQLSGPGIPGRRKLSLSHPGEALLAYLQQRPDPFPQGLDMILVSGTQVAAIPRTTQVEVI
ncbi:phosphonate C-P lyase system protein PhnH [Marinobacterium sp. YM272]|uniref:phosphonate C-P lyase system protein PhnH n=1 Tax=Marinobacterium sp. YM272 TaxID=3421654 RepID=UPI003D7F4D2E